MLYTLVKHKRCSIFWITLVLRRISSGNSLEYLICSKRRRKSVIWTYEISPDLLIFSQIHYFNMSAIYFQKKNIRAQCKLDVKVKYLISKNENKIKTSEVWKVIIDAWNIILEQRKHIFSLFACSKLYVQNFPNLWNVVMVQY